MKHSYNYKKKIFSIIELKKIYDEMFNSQIDIPQFIGNEKLFSGIKHSIYPPHDNKKIIGYWHEGSEKDIINAINYSLSVQKDWLNLSFKERISIFLKVVDLISGPYRDKLNAATMIGQSKNIFQSERDSSCKLRDDLKNHIDFAKKIYKKKNLIPLNYKGFVVAITQFNFSFVEIPYWIVIMGNVVLWKPSEMQLLTANVLMEIFQIAGIPDGIINLLLINIKKITNVGLTHTNFGGVTFKGPIKDYKIILKKIKKYIFKYKTYPMFLGKTIGKNFLLVHSSYNSKKVSTAILAGAFEYQGQKSSSISIAYIPKKLWKNKLKKILIEKILSLKIGSPRNFSNFITSVIDKISFLKIKLYIEKSSSDKKSNIIIGGKCDSSKGFFITPTVIETNNPYYFFEEIYSPVITIFLYEESNWKNILFLIKNSNKFITGSIFCIDKSIISSVKKKLYNLNINFHY
ncbi:MAG: aldehyde dehydrogenase family protein [Candidatus Karelsulcia muelleri]